jgi:integrase
MMIPQKGGICMKGGIYSEQKCPDCGGTFKDNHRDGLICSKHPDRHATRFRVRVGERGINKRFDNYREAQRFLTGVRFKHDEGSFDIREYRKGNPLGFRTLAYQWLEIKDRQLKRKSYRNLFNTIQRAIEAWGDRNIKEIGYPEIEDFLINQRLVGSNRPVSDKTKANMRSALHSFWTWLRKRRVLQLHQIPEFPEVGFELGFRNTIDKSTQEAILGEIHRLTSHIDPKIWLGVRWLCTYISLRPGELQSIRERDIDLGNGYLIIPHPKEKKPKLVPLLEEDVEALQKIPAGFPNSPFFRHPRGIKWCVAEAPYGNRYLYKWWKKACAKLGIEGVDLYGGTRHSSAIALRKYNTPEEIKRATMHTTNKAFERYFQLEADDLRRIYQGTRTKAIADDKIRPFKQR